MLTFIRMAQKCLLPVVAGSSRLQKPLHCLLIGIFDALHVFVWARFTHARTFNGPFLGLPRLQCCRIILAYDCWESVEKCCHNVSEWYKLLLHWLLSWWCFTFYCCRQHLCWHQVLSLYFLLCLLKYSAEHYVAWPDQLVVGLTLTVINTQ